MLPAAFQVNTVIGRKDTRGSGMVTGHKAARDSGMVTGRKAARGSGMVIGRKAARDSGMVIGRKAVRGFGMVVGHKAVPDSDTSVGLPAAAELRSCFRLQGSQKFLPFSAARYAERFCSYYTENNCTRKAVKTLFLKQLQCVRPWRQAHLQKTRRTGDSEGSAGEGCAT